MVLAETVITGRHDHGVSRDSLQGGMIMVLIETVITGRHDNGVSRDCHYREA